MGGVGLAGGITSQPQKQSQIVVRSVVDLMGDLRSDVVYFIDGQIDLGANSIEVPVGGLTLAGHGYAISSLSSSSAGAVIFTSPVGGSGDLNIGQMAIWSTGLGSQIFDIEAATGSESCEVNTVNLGTFAGDTASLGEIDGYRQFRTSDCAIIKPLDGLTFTGSWAGGFAINDTILLNVGPGVSVFKAGLALVFAGQSTSNLNAFSIDATTVVYDFAPANFASTEGFALNGARFNLASDPVPNMPEQSIKRFFKDCVGVRNTFSGGLWRITTTAATVITASSTPVKVAGTTTYEDLVYFSQGTDNEYTYDSSIPKDYRITGHLTVDGGPNDDIEVMIRQWDDSASTYINLASYTRNISNVVGGIDVADFSLFASARLSQNDRIELWVQNNTDTTNVTALAGYLAVDVRL